MPVIVYKTMTIELFYTQGRRIDCDNCGQPFVYIHGGVQSAQVNGVPLVSSDDSMRRNALKQAVAGLVQTAKVKNAGEAMCPHCQCYQHWMVSSSRWSSLGCGLLLGAVLLGVLPGVLNSAFEWTRYVAEIFIGGAIVGALVGATIGVMKSIKRGPHFYEKDARAMTDPDFTTFLESCESQNVDPFLYWWISLGNKPGDKQVPLSIGLEDQTRTRIHTQVICTDDFIAAQAGP